MIRSKYGWMALALAMACGGDDDGAVRTDARDAGEIDAGTSAPQGKPVMDAGLVRDAGHDAGADDAGDAGPSDALSGATLIDDLTPAQAQVQCEKVAAGARKVVDSIEQATCTMLGILVEAQRPDTCAASRDMCALNAASQAPDMSLTTFDCETDTPSNCPGLTVSEVEACASAYGAVAATIASFTCRSTPAEVDAARQTAVSPPACQAMLEKCGSD